MLAGCRDSRVESTLSHIDTLLNAHADSALAKLDSLKAEKPQWAKSQQMKYDLLYLKAQNKAFVPLKSDSTAKELVSYYNSHGTANEQMMSYYLLGCVYRDMGEAPQAIDAYQDAITKADTTTKDCDFYTLSCVYAQMAGLYHQQLLLSNEIEACRQASHFSFLAGDTLFSISEQDISTGAYILLNKKDSAELILKDVQHKYKQYGCVEDALQSSIKLMYIYVEEPNRISDVKELIDEYEANSNLFDKAHELNNSKRIFYYYKGKYYDEINQLDSAEFYYKKIYWQNMPYTAQNSMYKGLLSVFSKRHQADSIAKYAQLYCEVNDSSIAKKDQNLTAQMAASYNYNRFRKEAQENADKAHRSHLLLIAILIAVAIASTAIYLRWRSNRKRHEALKAEYADAIDQYHKNLHTLQLLESVHKELIAKIQGELKKSQSENQTYRQRIERLNVQYADSKQELVHENDVLKAKIDELKLQAGIRQQITTSQQFTNTEIVNRISYLIEHPLIDMTESEWEQFIAEASSYFPSLLHDLTNASSKITQQDIRVCLLVCLSLRESDIARLTKTSAQRVTNMKSAVNKELFGDSSARTLYKNLTQRYEIYAL